jgi:predicted O-methyltransferase YrrM
MAEFIKQHGIKDVLELGFFHGVSTCYIANALKDCGGHITTIDRRTAIRLEPNIYTLLERCSCADNTTVHVEHRTYFWRLMKMLEADPQPRFDLVYLDGGHTWDDTGYAFLLVDKLLRPGGWVIFDDLHWTMDKSAKRVGDKDLYKHHTQEARGMAQVKKVFDLLVRTNPRYGNFREKDGWGYAQKDRDEE